MNQIKTGVTTLFFLFASFSGIRLSAQVPPGTGATGPFNDQNFKIVTETLSPHQTAGCSTSAPPCSSNRAPAWIVKKRAGWAPELSGTQWIAPDRDQSNSLGNGRNFGSVTYQTQFMATPELRLNARVLADDNVVVSLNGTVVFSSTAAQHLSAAMIPMTGFVSGMNTVTFAVSNEGGGPNGLDVAFSDASAPPSGPALALNHPAYPDAMTFSSTAVGGTSAQTLYVINNGDATAAFAAIGPLTGSFSIDSNTQGCGAPLEPGAYCTFNVVFAPASAMPASQTGTLKISLQGGANPSTYTVNLAGTAAVLPTASLPSITYSPNPLVFPTTPVGAASAEQLVKITNSGGTAAIFSDFFLPSSHFAIDWKPPTAIPPPNSIPPCNPLSSSQPEDDVVSVAAGNSCVVGIAFKPTNTTTVTETFGMDLMCDPPCQGQVFNLSLKGTGGSGPILIFSPNPLVFPDTPAGTTSAPINVTVTNIGDAGKFSNMPTNSIFKLTGFACVSLPLQQIAHNGTCLMPFSFNPPPLTAPGIITANPLATPPTNPLNVGINTVPPTGEITYSLSAIGTVAAAAANGPAVTFSPTVTPFWNFSTAPGVPRTQILTIKNSGNAPLNIQNIHFATDGPPVYFDFVDGTPGSPARTACVGSPIAPNNTCVLNVTFRPGASNDFIGQFQAALIVVDDAPPGQQTVNMIGLSLGPKVVFDNTTLTMVAPAAGTTPVSATVTLTNTGNADLHITTVTVNGNAAVFSKGTDTCSNRTIPLTSPQCTVQFNFIPSAGPSQTTVTFPDDAIPTTQTITLVGKITGSSTSTNSAPSLNGVPATPDPIDGATGQLYDRIVDFAPGGPMGFGFARYYSSALASTGVASGLGANWMSGFDVALSVSGTTAKALLFGGRVVTFASSGALWQLVSPLDPAYQLVQSGTAFKLMDPSNSMIYSFSAGGVLTRIEDRKGNAVTITSGTSGPTAATDGLGRTLTFTYTNGNLTKLTDQAGRSVTFNYQGNLLVSSTDLYNQTTNYSYTSAGALTALLTKKQLPLGNVPTTQAYDASGRVVTQTDPNNHVTKVAYDGNGGTTITDALGNVTRQGNDSNGSLTQLTDPVGAALAVTFDSSNRGTSFTDKLGNRTSYTYDQPSGKRASFTDALGNTTSYTYASQTQGGFTFYNLSGISYPDGTSSSFTYDSNGNLLSLTARDGTTTAYVYDSNGRMTRFTGANGKVSTSTWNADSTMATATDPLGNVTSFTYDSLKRLTGVADPNGGKTGYVYDQSATGPMLAITRPGGGSTTIYDDQNGQVQDEANTNGGVFHSDYTATGKISAFTDPLKNKTAYAYDADDRLSSITSPAGEAVSYAYDTANRVVSVSDANGPRISYTYTSEGNIATSTDGSGRKSAYTYDALGRIATATTPGGNKYATAYDKLGRVSSRTNPLGEVEAWARDAEGRLTSVTMPGAITTALKRDAAGSIASITSPNGNAWTIGYDALERPSKFTDPLGQATGLTYSGTLLSGATLPLGTLAITSDLNGRITKRQYSDGTTVNVAYDGNGLIGSADGFTVKRDAKGQPTNINGIAITLDPVGRPAALTYASGKTIAYTYDKGGRLAFVADWVGGKTTLTYDGASRLASLTYPNGVANIFTYDADGRVTKIAVGSIASITLARDAAGKITSADRNVPRLPALQNGGQQLTYDAAGQLTSATNDAMGRVTVQGARRYTWNLASQLTAFADGVNSASFSYDGLGELGSSTFSGAAQTFVYNYALHYPALSIVRKGANDQRYYVYLSDGTLLYSIEAADNTRRFYHFDEMGNTTLLTDDAGGVLDSYAITPYGEIADHLGATENPFTWQGKYGVIQEGQGLYYVRSRHYDASAARFISRDPEMSANARSSEPYAYAAGNPLRFIDPFGTASTLTCSESPFAWAACTDITLPGSAEALARDGEGPPLLPARAESYATTLQAAILAYVFGGGLAASSYSDSDKQVFADYLSRLYIVIGAHLDLDWQIWAELRGDIWGSIHVPFPPPPAPAPVPPAPVVAAQAPVSHYCVTSNGQPVSGQPSSCYQVPVKSIPAPSPLPVKPVFEEAK